MGLGDDIMASGEARLLKRTHARAKIVVGDGEREFWSDLFDGNPNLTRLADVRPDDDVVWLRNYAGCRPYIDYARSIGGHLQVFTAYRAIVGDIVCSTAERADTDVLLRDLPGLPLVSVEPNVAFGPNKDWGFAKWQAVVDRLRGRVTFVQPSYGKPLLSGVYAMPCTFRGYCAMLARCDLHVGPEGALHHAAAALGRPAVVIFGGRLHPDITGYAGHVNLYADLPGSPCGMVAPCAHCRQCLDSISVETVVAQIRKQISHHRDTEPQRLPISGTTAAPE